MLVFVNFFSVEKHNIFFIFLRLVSFQHSVTSLCSCIGRLKHWNNISLFFHIFIKMSIFSCYFYCFMLVFYFSLLFIFLYLDFEKHNGDPSIHRKTITPRQRKRCWKIFQGIWTSSRCHVKKWIWLCSKFFCFVWSWIVNTQ